MLQICIVIYHSAYVCYRTPIARIIRYGLDLEPGHQNISDEKYLSIHVLRPISPTGYLKKCCSSNAVVIYEYFLSTCSSDGVHCISIRKGARDFGIVHVAISARVGRLFVNNSTSVYRSTTVAVTTRPTILNDYSSEPSRVCICSGDTVPWYSYYCR